MILFNLLPYRKNKKQKKLNIEIIGFAVCLVLICLSMLIYNGFLKTRIQNLTKENRGVKTSFLAAKKELKKLEKIKKKISALTIKIKTFKQVSRQREEPAIILSLMTELLVPQKMRFERLKIDENSIKIKGLAIDNKTIADFITKIEKSKKFANVKLESTRQEKLRENLYLQSFLLNIDKAFSKLMEKS